MTRLLRDSIDPSLIPVNTALIGGYVDGRFGPDHALFGEPGWDASSWDLFPNSVHVKIAVFATTNDGNVGDVEFGDITPAQAPTWVLMRRAAGVQPSIYCSLSSWPSVRTAFQNAGVIEPPYWIADYDGTTTIFEGSVARQYDNGTGIVGPSVNGAYDSSAVLDYWPGIDPPVPAPRRVIGEPMVTEFLDTQSSPGILRGFELPASSLTAIYTATSSDGNFLILARTPLPGEWLTIERVGRYKTELFFRGTGVDGKLYQTTLQDGQTVWSDPGAPIA